MKEFPKDQLRAAAAHDREAQERIEALHKELSTQHPSSAKIKEHARQLGKHPALAAIVENWIDDPRTQAFINELILAGL
jgi:hypothetical protein